MSLSRRRFLSQSASLSAFAVVGKAVAAKAAEQPAAMPPPKRGANERIRVAVAGINGQGTSHMGGYAGMKDVEIVYLVDPDSRLFESRAKSVEDKAGYRPKCVQDIRKVLEDKSVDVVSIATPNHWHSLMTIWACQAGKDVYVEKPMSHNIHEGRIAVETARKYNRIVQHGTQSRSDMKWAKVVAAIASGKLGKLLISRALCYKPGGGHNTRGDLGFKPYTNPPKELDFDLWLGPARKQPYHENLVHYRWHWFWDFGNGDLGNQGVHQMDIARWGIPGATLPKSVYSFGGRLGFFDQGEAACTQMAVMDFGETKLIFETRGLKSPKYMGVDVGNIFHLEAGDIVNGKFYPKGSNEEAPLPEVEATRGPGGDRLVNFLAAVRSRKVSDLNADILEGHYSSALCHLCNMSIRLGSKIPFRPRDTTLESDPVVLDLLERTEQHLAENGVDIEKSGFVLGRKLVVDAGTETIVDDPEANQLLTRHYRKGFEVPDKV
ncbi:MAG TPA: Gfo/Idh/MocA family oxidoreductase [Phycisphaerae bacterium]|nr:Gfo/Idh/MocA family oxidoreductase [Phycisphaerae bacterium]HRR84330.1 Gfo/Idh/MocA family oxidoreductase [Phycisphaerae bacterium]